MGERQDHPARAVMVTGGAKRLGAEIIRRFARDGWRCVIHHRSSEAEAEHLAVEIRAAGGAATPVRFDLADPAAIEAGLSAAFDAEPGLEVLINSASIFDYDCAGAPSAAVWNQALAVNSLGPILLSASFAKRLKQAGEQGCIVNVLDQKLQNLNPDFFSYTVSKAALKAASEIMARDYAPAVRVANVALGLVLPSGDQTEAEFERSAVMNLLERRTRIEEVVDGIYFVATSPYLTGQTLYIDSGQSLTAQPRDVMFLVRQPDAD